MKIPTAYLPHTVDVQPLAGRSSVGDVHGPSFPVRCMAQQQRRLVRDSEGNEVLSSLTVICEPGQAASIPTGSLVAWRGASSVVIGSTDHDDGGLGAPQHTEVVCE